VVDQSAQFVCLLKSHGVFFFLSYVDTKHTFSNTTDLVLLLPWRYHLSSAVSEDILYKLLKSSKSLMPFFKKRPLVIGVNWSSSTGAMTSRGYIKRETEKQHVFAQVFIQYFINLKLLFFSKTKQMLTMGSVLFHLKLVEINSTFTLLTYHKQEVVWDTTQKVSGSLCQQRLFWDNGLARFSIGIWMP
jgi:hypothetical protein